MFLSKKSEGYLPDLWPSYYKSAKGCYVKDLDNNSFIDHDNECRNEYTWLCK